MTTPITDEASFSTVHQGELVTASFARRLELDRAIFRQSLIDIYLSPAADSRALANAALQAASKFEGEEYTP